MTVNDPSERNRPGTGPAPGASRPLACALPANDFRDRVARIEAILREGLIEMTPLAEGVRGRFSASAKTEAELRNLVKREADCCAFLTMTVRSGDDDLFLEVTGPPQVQTLINELFSNGAATGKWC